MINLFLLLPFFIAKTEHKAEMEFPAAAKVKVVDFFQRLVRGLLTIYSHISYMVVGLVYSLKDIKCLWVCVLS